MPPASFPTLRSISDAIEPLRQKLLDHPLYRNLKTLEDLRVFMEFHVFAVWDFMSLLKALQRDLTCVSLPWMPVGNAEARKLINQIVLGEESDTDPEGRVSSHFELYLESMHEAGAKTHAMDRFVQRLQEGDPVSGALQDRLVPLCVAAFVNETFSFIEAGKTHQTAAAFTYGREDLIPGVFGELVASLDSHVPGNLGKFRYYLDRHIELDGDEHGELGRQMVASVCGEDPVRWQEAANTAVQALESRLRLWDGIHAAILERPVNVC